MGGILIDNSQRKARIYAIIDKENRHRPAKGEHHLPQDNSFFSRLKTLKNMDFDRDVSEASYRSRIISQYRLTVTAAIQTLRNVLKAQGLPASDIANHQDVLIQASIHGYIEDSAPWARMLKDKDMQLFFFDDEGREAKLEEIRTVFLPAFEDLEVNLLER